MRQVREELERERYRRQHGYPNASWSPEQIDHQARGARAWVSLSARNRLSDFEPQRFGSSSKRDVAKVSGTNSIRRSSLAW
jgi:hypothetical protein